MAYYGDYFMSNEQSYPMPSHAGSGPSKVITFLMKVDDIELLDEVVTKFPAHMNRSDVIREMILPYLHALRLARKGKDWNGLLQYGGGLNHLKSLLAQEENEHNPSYSYSI